MDIVCISDTHRQRFAVPDGDLLIHSGDLTSMGTHEELYVELAWLGSLPHKHKVFVPGNHDWFGEKLPELTKLTCQDNNIHYLCDSEVIIEGVKIYGSPWTPEFFNWAFNLPRGEKLKRKWDMIPSDIDILVTHGGPMGTLDIVPGGYNVGCEELRIAVERVKPKLHVFGHIHHSAGISIKGGTLFVNASICTESYNATNKPYVINYE